jgi:hypothetical protein
MTAQRITGGLLVAGFITAATGVVMFVGGGGLDDTRSATGTYLIWERGFFVSAVVLTALGFVLLAEMLEARSDQVFARLGSTTFLIAAVLVVAAELMGLPFGEPNYRLIVAYVVLALIGQAVLGVSVLWTHLLRAWIGWAAIAWSLGWLVFLVIANPDDVYFPILHHVIPFVIGVSLLAGERKRNVLVLEGHSAEDGG